MNKKLNRTPKYYGSQSAVPKVYNHTFVEDYASVELKPKRVFWIRHGESVANAGDHHAVDPVLTELGHEQADGVAAGLLERFRKESDAGKKVHVTVVISPLRRTVQTATRIFRDVARLPNVFVKGVINHDIREINHKPSGMGSQTDVLFKIWEEHMPETSKLIWKPERQGSWNAGEMTDLEKIMQSDRMAVAHDKMCKHIERIAEEWTDDEYEVVFAIAHWGIVNVYGNLYSKGWALSAEAAAERLADESQKNVEDSSKSLQVEEVQSNDSMSTMAETPRGTEEFNRFPAVDDLLNEEKEEEEIDYDQPRADIRMDPARFTGPWLHVPEEERELVRLLDLRNCEVVAFDLP